MKIIFLGTPEFGAIILEKLVKGNYKPALVVTNPDKPAGRKKTFTSPPVKIIAQKYDIPVAQPERIMNYELGIRNLKPNLVIVVAYGEILPKEILDIPKFGCLNVHPSLLPKYRGPSPIQSAILNGDKKTGVSIVLMDEKMDHGPILSQRATEIDKEETGESLCHKLADLGGDLLMETFPKWIRKIIKPQPQDNTEATYTKILTRLNGKINWKKTAQELEREIRTYLPWPGSYTFWERNKELVKIKILKARIFKSVGGVSFPVGKTVVVPQNEIGVQCGGKDFLVIEKLQMEGKKETGAEEFLRGYLDFIGTILE